MKKSVQQSNKFIFMLISFLFLIFLFVGNISAENCIIKSKVTCSAEQGHAILGLSGLTNAHGELIAQNNYENVLCCDFGFGDTTCDGTVHKILGLSDETNAHAEIPSLSNYGFPVCYDGVKNCVAINADSLCMDLGLTKIITLSADTNAHIGGYSTSSARKICCEIEPVGSLCEIDSNCAPGLVCDNGQCIAPVSEVYWALPQNLGSIIYNIQADVGTTTISMVLKYSGLPEGTQVDFDIYEKDFIGGYIKTISGIVDSDGHAYINWTISEGDIEKAFSSLGEGDELEYFYFKTTGMASNELIVTIVECASINSCVDYNDENSCEGDACETASSPLCDDDPLVDCWCAWDDINNECKTMAGTDEEFYCGYCGDNMVNLSWEECDDGNHENGDGCSAGCMIEDTGKWCGDGIVNQNWEECDDGNNGWNANACSPSCQIQEIDCDEAEIPSGFGSCSITEITDDNCDDGFLTYSWEGTWSGSQEGSLYEKCVAGGTRTVPCPAQIALPFFGIYNVIIACIAIALVYWFLAIKKKGNKKKR